MLTRILTIATLAIIPLSGIGSGGEDWAMVTDTSPVRDLVCIDEDLWLATEGGLVQYEIATSSYRTLTTLDGLSGIAATRLLVDGEGGFWIAFENRTLQRWDPKVGITHSVGSLAMQEGIFTLKDLALDERGLFVGGNRGVAQINYNRTYDEWVWYEEYRRFGTFPADLQANAVAVRGNFLWVGTSAGVARGDLTTPSPLDWRNYTTADGLQNNLVNDLLFFRDTLYAATGDGLARLEGDRWRPVDYRRDVYRLYERNDSLFVVTSDGFSHWTGRQWVRIGGRILGSTSATWDKDGAVWIGRRRDTVIPGGIALLEDSLWIEDVPPGPTSNFINAIAFDPSGGAYLAGGKGGDFGLGRRMNGEWTRWRPPEFVSSAFYSPARSIAFDLDGGVWLGTFGGGVGWITGDSIKSFTAAAETGSRLKSYDVRTASTLAPAVAADGGGNIWITNRGATDGYNLVCVPRSYIQTPDTSDRWHYFHRVNFGQFEHYDLLAVDSRDRIWLASTANDQTLPGDQGVYVLDYRGTPADSSDDRIYGPIPGLPAKEVLSLKHDPAGYMWVGSIRGAYYLSLNAADLKTASFSQVYYLRDIPIRSIDVDPAGNKWFASDFGVSVLAPDNFTILRRISSDPPDRLPATAVQSVAVDPHSGWVYFGTREGTAALRTPYRDYGSSIVGVTFEPNPFDPRKSRMIFTGTSLAGGASARIFTPDGRLVRKLSRDEAALGWDGLDDAGAEVADGVYLVMTHNGGGESAIGKVALLRR